jgi:aspartate carbamoyltransferase catalytic subunit
MHLISTSEIRDRGELDRLFKATDALRNPHISGIDPYYRARGKIMTIVKDEGSTRTRLSFEIAMKRLGGEAVVLELDTSSALKGESLADTMRSISEYSDVIVLRHSQRGAVASLSSLRVPIINAGDGDGEHPTQALTDVYTLQKELGGIDGLNILLAGDLKHSRTIHSLIRLLALYRGVRLVLVSPEDLRLPREYYDFLEEKGVACETETSLSRQLKGESPMAVYMTREQKERANRDCSDYPALGVREMGMLEKDCIVMHPLPRCEELPLALDEDPRCAVWKQVKNGMYVRMALLSNLFNHNCFLT